MKNPIFLVVAIIASCLAVSCYNADCINTNPVFEQLGPETKEYQEELAKILESGTIQDPSFTLERYEEKDGIPYLHMEVTAENLCAKATVLVLTLDENIKNLKKVKGEGYAGSEFKNLKYKVFRDEAKTVLLYEGVGSIID